MLLTLTTCFNPLSLKVHIHTHNVVQGDQKVSVHLSITVQKKTRKNTVF
jgi:hypothetical protein